jgi:OHCU decarboxylase
MLSLDELNALPETEASARLRECCGSSGWVTRMMNARPFANVEALFKAADRAWEGTKAGRLARGVCSPSANRRASKQRVEREEQHEAGRSTAQVRARIAELNREYEERFGHIYIVCASGRTGVGDSRGPAGTNGATTPSTSCDVAAREQHRITRLRLGKLIGVEDP